MHYSRVAPVVSGQRYFPSTAIFLVEVIKLIVSLSIASYDIWDANPSQSTSKLLKRLSHSVFTHDSWKLTIPAALWTLQNSIVYIAVSNLDPATFQVTYQLKILMTVLFSILMLGKKVSSRQWLALVLLTIGVAIVQTEGPLVALSALATEVQSRLTMLITPQMILMGHLGDATKAIPAEYASQANINLLKQTGQTVISQGSPTPISPTMNAPRGLLAVVAASTISGITGVYFEKVLKDPSSTATGTSGSKATLWTRNVQLSLFSLFPALILGVVFQDGREISRAGFFVGYSSLVWAMIALQAGGGIIVAVCISYADNIAKNFAASISIVCSSLMSVFLFDSPLTVNVSRQHIFPSLTCDVSFPPRLPLPLKFTCVYVHLCVSVLTDALHLIVHLWHRDRLAGGISIPKQRPLVRPYRIKH
jgi:solute carrier family 35 (UDP-sugar transporter), member A1/2/3